MNIIISKKGYKAIRIKKHELRNMQRFVAFEAKVPLEQAQVAEVPDKGVVVAYYSKSQNRQIVTKYGNYLLSYKGSIFPYTKEALIKEDESFKKLLEMELE